jgi:hypothetical protein
MLDKVAVKGTSKGVNIYTAKRNITDEEQAGWKQHGMAMKIYYDLDFVKAKSLFLSVKEHLPNDYVADLFIERCERYTKNPPGQNWNRTEVKTSK